MHVRDSHKDTFGVVFAYSAHVVPLLINECRESLVVTIKRG